jgi:hypothetical protein
VLEDGKQLEPILYGIMFPVGIALSAYLILKAARGGKRTAPAPSAPAGDDSPADPPDEPVRP